MASVHGGLSGSVALAGRRSGGFKVVARLMVFGPSQGNDVWIVVPISKHQDYDFRLKESKRNQPTLTIIQTPVLASDRGVFQINSASRKSSPWMRRLCCRFASSQVAIGTG